MIQPRMRRLFPVFDVACPGGTLKVTFLDRDRIHIWTDQRRNYDYSRYGRKWTVENAYIVNGVEHRIDAVYIHVFGTDVIGHWHSRVDGAEMPADLWTHDKKQGMPLWKREDYGDTHKWVSDSAYEKIKKDVLQCLHYALNAWPDALEEAHTTHVWNALADLEKEIMGHEQEIQKLYNKMEAITNAQDIA